MKWKLFFEAYREPLVENLCVKDPCANIAKAVVGSCSPIGSHDFQCQCQHSHAWNDDANACISRTNGIFVAFIMEF